MWSRRITQVYFQVLSSVLRKARTPGRAAYNRILVARKYREDISLFLIFLNI